MTKSENKTKATDADVQTFLRTVTDEQRRRDAGLLIDLMSEVTGLPAVLWGTSIIGFGSRHYRYESGREGDMPVASFAPRAGQTVLYLSGGLDRYEDLLPRLGPCRTGKGCLYLKRVDATDTDVLRAIVARSYEWARPAPGGDSG